MWDFFETVRHRHSIRKYRPDVAVEKEKLNAILETACAAPSAGDLQAYQITVVTEPSLRAQLSQAAGAQGFISEAPVCLVFSTDGGRSASKYGDRGRELYALQDTTIAATYAQLATVAAGLSSTWVGFFDEAEVSRLLDLHAGLKPVALLCIGYPAEMPQPTPRRHLGEVVSYK